MKRAGTRQLASAKTLEWLRAGKRPSGFRDCARRFICPNTARRISSAAALTSPPCGTSWSPSRECFCSTASRERASPRLALQFAWEAQKDFDAVIFQTCGQRLLDAITAEMVGAAADRRQDPSSRGAARRGQILAARAAIASSVGRRVVAEVKNLRLGRHAPCCIPRATNSLPWISAKQSTEVEKVHRGGSGGVVSFLSGSGVWRERGHAEIAMRCSALPRGSRCYRLQLRWGKPAAGKVGQRFGASGARR